MLPTLEDYRNLMKKFGKNETKRILISLNDLVAHYKLYYFKELGDSYDVYPYVRCLTCYQNQCLFPKDLQCFKRRKFK